MRRLKPFLFAATLAGVWLLASSDTFVENYNGYTPYFMERSELEKSVFYDAAVRPMEDPGKIWISGDEIYVVERYKGVHAIDNSDPAAPVQTGFIVAPGCMDVAIKDGTLYLDNAVDLVAFDLTAGKVTERLEHYFPEPASPNGDRYRNGYYGSNYSGNYSDMILVGWKKVNDKK